MLKIAEAHGGDITPASRDGGGLTVTLIFPFSKAKKALIKVINMRVSCPV
ncbi:HAMP domain-containing histidine kinase [Janthinobacterium agaricidamnosum]|uniref:Uncharacterized protein n=1 Tax=Janthinobacterium agaricidamnosum NBRC 102515 = DSM 9628 TaxID=1349767 RepID=W0VCE1_9BURK|nr:HAMP domain-containing histidine kinase [Janthinobacterium agaricidamnosum]CDG85566.1 hypothetical protein GJA_4963 [Janthinobacterium agaricidamnosum NBRC 102515 = DSM 9628]